MGALSKLAWNEDAQAKWLLRRLLTDLRLDVPLTSYFHTVDLVGYRGKTNFKGLLRGEDYTPKPSYYAMQHLCALFDSETGRVDLAPELLDQEKVHLQEAMFARDGRALYAYWYPADLLQPWKPRPIAVQLTWPGGASIESPVLIDMLSGIAYKPEHVEVTAAGLVARELPLMDYPLILTDKKVIQ